MNRDHYVVADQAAFDRHVNYDPALYDDRPTASELAEDDYWRRINERRRGAA